MTSNILKEPRTLGVSFRGLGEDGFSGLYKEIKENPYKFLKNKFYYSIARKFIKESND